jgi:hypothetical protein
MSKLTKKNHPRSEIEVSYPVQPLHYGPLIKED